jgi:ribosomal protein S18 acetylase RimI-like enzyme
VRGPLFAALDEPLRSELLAQQFAAREIDRRTRHPAARHLIVERDGSAVGAVTIDDSGADCHVLDLAILPAAQGRGTASAVLAELAGGSGGRDLVLEVDVANAGAQRLYARLGFVGESATETDVTMRRAARPATD